VHRCQQAANVNHAVIANVASVHMITPTFVGWWFLSRTEIKHFTKETCNAKTLPTTKV